ncbi:MAG: outer membrane protein transport protein [Myxococcota bacterium]
MLSLLLLSQAAEAAGYYYLDMGTRGSARAGAFVASADDISAQYYNPAALIRLNDPQIYVNVSGVSQTGQFQRIDYDDNGNVSETFDQVENQDSAFAIPAVGFASRFGLPNTVFAFGLYTPFAPSSLYPQDGPQRYSLIDSLIWQVYTGPSVSHRFNDWLSVGVGLNWTLFRAEQELTISTCDPSADSEVCEENPEQYDVDVAVTMWDLARFSWNAGVLIEPVEWLAIGASVIPPVNVNGGGSMSADFGEAHYLVETVPILTDSTFTDDDIRVQLTVPWVFRLGAAVYPTDALEIELTGVYQTWSVTEQIVVTDVDLALGLDEENFFVQTLELEEIVIEDDIELLAGFRDAWSLRLGGEYTIRDGLQARGGVAYETSAIPTASLSVSQIDAPKIIYGLGATYVYNDRIGVDVGFSQTFLQQQDITTSDARQIAIPLFPLDISNDFENLDIEEGPVVGNGRYTSMNMYLSAGLTYYFKGKR